MSDLHWCDCNGVAHKKCLCCDKWLCDDCMSFWAHARTPTPPRRSPSCGTGFQEWATRKEKKPDLQSAKERISVVVGWLTAVQQGRIDLVQHAISVLQHVRDDLQDDVTK